MYQLWVLGALDNVGNLTDLGNSFLTVYRKADG